MMKTVSWFMFLVIRNRPMPSSLGIFRSDTTTSNGLALSSFAASRPSLAPRTW